MCWALPILIAALFSSTPALAEIAAPTQTSIDRQIADARAAMMVDPQSAARSARKAAAIAVQSLKDRHSQDLALATTDWLQAEAAFRMGEFTAALPFIDAAAGRVGAQQSQLLGDVLLTRGSLHGAQAQVSEALADFQTAFETFRGVRNTRSQAIALMLIAALYRDGKDSAGALRYLIQASDIYQGDPGLMVALYNNRGGVLQDLGRHAEAEQQLRKALAYAEQMKSPVLTAQVLRNIARNRLKAGQTGAAERAVRRSLAIATTREAAGGRPQLLALAAEAAYQRGNLRQAATLIDQSFAGVDLDRTEMTWREPHETAYRVFSRLGRYQPALRHLAALKRIEDDATTLATNTGNALMAARFDFANQELRIAKLKADELRRSIALEQTRARVQQIFFIGAGGATAVVIVLLAIGLFTIRRSRNEVRDARDGLALTNVALSKALAAKTEFLATTSHEIRTPLNGILGMTQVMLADTRLTGTMRDRLSVVQGAGLTMRALVDDILDVAKMEAGSVTIAQEAVELRATMTDAARMWEEQARAKGLAFALDLSACPPLMTGDRARLRQIVFNLLSNAVKFTATGRVTMTVAAEAGQLTIAVADTGIGIAADKQGEVFESFRQADASTTRQYGGTGLGLAICRNLATAMGGNIAVASAPGEGATFTVTVPFVAPAEMPVADPVAPAPALLVLDRNPITRSMWRTLLERRAGRLVFAATAAEAVALIAAGNVSRVLIDEATLCTDPAPADAAAAIVAAAIAAGAETSLLWTIGKDGGDALARGMTRLIGKPVAGAALAATLLGDTSDEPTASSLVSRAA